VVAFLAPQSRYERTGYSEALNLNVFSNLAHQRSSHCILSQGAWAHSMTNYGVAAPIRSVLFGGWIASLDSPKTDQNSLSGPFPWRLTRQARPALETASKGKRSSA